MLIVTIAHQEDAKRYKGPVTFYNKQLMPLIGVAKWEALDKARKPHDGRRVAAFLPGNKRSSRTRPVLGDDSERFRGLGRRPL